MFFYIGPEFARLLLKRDPGEMLSAFPIDCQRIRGKDAEQEKQNASELSEYSMDMTKDERNDS